MICALLVNDHVSELNANLHYNLAYCTCVHVALELNRIVRKLSTKSNELLLMACVLKINCKLITYIFFFELARFIGIKSFLRFILIDQVISMLE